jgi:hypothetical protein
MSDDRAIPVLCIHGALRSRLGMWPTARAFGRLGFDARTYGYPTRHGTLEIQGRRLADFIAAWIGDEPPEVLGFFTHSMGGLVVRAWLPHAARVLPGVVQRVVMLSPPNRGSQLARLHRDNPLFNWMYGDAALELGSDAASKLPGAAADVDVLVLAGGTGSVGYNPRLIGDDDGVVAISEMGLPGVDPVLVGGVHSILQWSPALIRRAARFIRTGNDDAS